MKITTILDYLLSFIFINNNLNKNKILKAETKLYEVKSSISDFYLNEILNDKKHNKDDLLNKLYSSNYQYIYKKIINSKYFNNKIISFFCNNNTFFFPLNDDILKIIYSKGIKVNFLISKILFILLKIIIFFKNIINIILFLITSIKFNFKKNKNIVYLSYIPEINPDENFPKVENFYSWVKRYFKISNYVYFLHTNKNIHNQIVNNKKYELENNDFLNYCLSINKLLSLITSIISAVYFILKTSKNSKLGKLNCLIFQDLIIYFFLKSNKDLKPKLCLFSNIELLYRPFWTYALEDRTYLYYMSTNTNFNNTNNSKIEFYDLFLTKFYTWNKYICWTNEQKKWILDNAFLSNPKIKLCKYIPYQGKNIILNKSKDKKVIAIFDVPPKSDKLNKTFLNPYNVYSENFCIKFIDDLLKNTSNKNYQLFIKLKYINEDISLKYLRFIDKIEKKYKKNVKIYRGGISASSIIKISEVVFSLPFSSPSLLAKRMKVKSYYYDPFNFIKHTKYNNKSVKIIKTVNELKKVLKGI